MPFQAENLIDVACRMPEGGPYAYTGSLVADQVMAIAGLRFDIALVRGNQSSSVIVGNATSVECGLGPHDTRIVIHNHPSGMPYPTKEDIIYTQLLRERDMPDLTTTGVLTPKCLMLWSVQNNEFVYRIWNRMPSYHLTDIYLAYAEQFGIVFDKHPAEKVLEYF